MAGPYVTNGKGVNVITDRLQLTQATYTLSPRYLAFGESSGQARTTNNLAGTIGGRTSAVGTANGQSQESLVTTTATSDTYQVVGTLTASGTWAITEAGMFTNPASGTGDMFAYSDFAVINLASGDSIQFTWKVQMT